MGMVATFVASAGVKLHGMLLAAETSILKTVITADMMNGVFDEVVGVLPTAMPVMVSFIALRKGINFVQGILQSA